MALDDRKVKCTTRLDALDVPRSSAHKAKEFVGFRTLFSHLFVRGKIAWHPHTKVFLCIARFQRRFVEIIGGLCRWFFAVDTLVFTVGLIKYEPRWFGPTDNIVKIWLQGIKVWWNRCSHIIHSLGGEYCWIVLDSEPIRLLKSPRSLSVYVLKCGMFCLEQLFVQRGELFEGATALLNEK